MDSITASPSSEEPSSNLKSILPVVVAGLRDSKDEAGEYYPWENYWLDRLQIPDFPEIMMFDPGLNEEDLDPNILSPSWIDRTAHDLLEAVELKRKACSGHNQHERNQIVFFGEGVAGIILKKALILASTENKYADLIRDTCACLLIGVPHNVPSSELWPQLLMGLILPFWRALPMLFWSSTASLPKYLQDIASDFVPVAYRMEIITMYDVSSRSELRGFKSMTHLHLAHERRISYVSWSKHAAKFDRYDDDAVREMFANLTRAASVPPESRDYLRELCHMSPPMAMPDPERVPSMAETILDFFEDESDKLSTVIIYGSRGVGKKQLSGHVFRRLLSRDEISNSIAYFSFEALDDRRRSISTMLVKIIQQLLACEPLLIPLVCKFHMSSETEDTRWTEGNLWVQLRSIIHQSKSRYIYLVIDSLMHCNTPNVKGFIDNLFNLRFIALERLRFVCTGTATMTIPTPPAIIYITLDEKQEFKDHLATYHSRLVEKLVSENHKLKPIKAKVEECLGKSKQFLHSNLLAHRIGNIDTFSCTSNIDHALDQLAIGCEATIVAIMSTAPWWVSTIISCMIMVLRPLRPVELAVAFAITTDPQFGRLELATEFDERTIPLDIQGDLLRHLGPLVCVQHGEIKISHAYIQEVLQGWLDRTGSRTASHDMVLTTRLMNYLQLCLKRLDAGGHKEIPNDQSFGLLKYCLEHWHAHYCKFMEDVKIPLAPRPAEMWLEDLVLSLFRTPAYLPWLQPIDEYGLKARGEQLDACQLAARLGLFNIFVELTNKDTNIDLNKKSSQVIACQQACQYGHGKIVEYLVGRLNEVDIEVLLTRACQRGEDTIVMFMLDRYMVLRNSTDIPQNLLPEVCRMGHVTLAEKLIHRGAKVNERPEGSSIYLLPLHEAVDQGHLGIVELLLKEKADPMALFHDESTPLLHSVERGYRLISNRLLEVDGLEDTPNNKGVTALHLAARRGDIDLLKKILKVTQLEGPRPEHSTSLLHEAAEHGQLEAVEILLKRFPGSINELNLEGHSALFLALHKNQSHVAKYLLKDKDLKIHFGDVYADSVLRQAIIHGNSEATEAILRLPGANVQRYEDTESPSDCSPLTDAAWKNNTEIIRALLSAGASPAKTVSPNLKEEDEILGQGLGEHWTFAHFAAYHDSRNVMHLLMSEHAELADRATSTGHTPLHLAAVKDRIEIVNIMLPGAKEAAKIITKETTSNTPNAEPKISTTDQPTTTSKTSQSAAEGRSQSCFNLNARTSKGLTALHISVVSGNLDLVKMLIKGGADSKLHDSQGRTILHFAVSSLNSAADMLHYLLQPIEEQPKVDTDQRDFDGKTPLHYAVEYSDEAAVRVLLRHGADPNLVSDTGVTSLYLAAASGCKAIVSQLLDYDADLSAKSSTTGSLTALHAAVSGGHKELVKYLLGQGADVNAFDSRRDTLLHEAARQGNRDIVQILLGAEASIDVVNGRNITPLQRAILNRWSNVASILLDAGADPNIRDEDGDNALTAAILTSNKDLVKKLLKSGVDYDFLNYSDMTPLMLALRSPKDILPLLIERKPDICKCGGNGITVLHRIAVDTYSSDIESVLPLLEYGKDHLNVRDAEGQAPVHHAAKHGRVGMLEKLQTNGADIEATDLQGRTAMHHAVRSMSTEEFATVFKSFLKPGKKNKVNIADLDGWTPLHWACKGPFPEVVTLLLHSCDTVPDRIEMALQGERDWTALAVAEFHCNSKIVQLLEQELGVVQEIRTADGLEWTIRTVPSDFGGTEPAQSSMHLRSVKPGYVNRHIWCDDCLHRYICGPRFTCRQHINFNLCFKCYRHSDKTHYPQGHKFDRLGGDYLDEPDFLDPPRRLVRPSPPGSPVKILSRVPTLDIAELITTSTTTSSTTSNGNETELLDKVSKLPSIISAEPEDNWSFRSWRPSRRRAKIANRGSLYMDVPGDSRDKTTNDENVGNTENS